MSKFPSVVQSWLSWIALISTWTTLNLLLHSGSRNRENLEALSFVLFSHFRGITEPMGMTVPLSLLGKSLHWRQGIPGRLFQQEKRWGRVFRTQQGAAHCLRGTLDIWHQRERLRFQICTETRVCLSGTQGGNHPIRDRPWKVPFWIICSVNFPTSDETVWLKWKSTGLEFWKLTFLLLIPTTCITQVNSLTLPNL